VIKNHILVGICVGPTTDIETVRACINSLRDQKFNRYDSVGLAAMLVGDKEHLNKIVEDQDYMYGALQYVYVHPFDESVKKGWITKKKNEMVDYAYDNGYRWTCLVHDYYKFDPDWLIEITDWLFEEENEQYQLVMNPIYTAEGTRHSDWLLDQRFVVSMMEQHPHIRNELMAIAPNENHPKYVCGLPYSEKDMTNMQYISGGYIFGNTEVLKAIPLDETRTWGEEEDLEWSQRLRGARIKIGFCPYATVRLTKPGKWHLHELSPNAIQILKSMFHHGPVLPGNDYR